MIRRRLAATALTAGLGLACCGCLNLGHSNGNATTTGCTTGGCLGLGGGSSNGSGGGGLFSFLHRRSNNTTTAAAIECCPTTDCPTCGVDGYEGPALEAAPTLTQPPLATPAPQVIPVVPGATLPSTAPPARIVPMPATSLPGTSTQMPWSP